MKPRILFLTNNQNGAPSEDELLIKFLKDEYELVIRHPLDCLPYLRTISAVIIRNIWPTHEYAQEWDDIETAIRKTGLPVYNPLTGHGDVRGKGYLVDLSRQGFPVIPSVNNIRDINNLGRPGLYWVKPNDGCDGWGSCKLTEQALRRARLDGFIIQPYIEFTSEPSFFFVDNVFSHAITMPNRIEDRFIEEYYPTVEDMEFAQKFVDWNSLPYGIQRIDGVRTKNGKLLLTEVEDLCPYLYLSDVPAKTRNSFLNLVRQSMAQKLGSQVDYTNSRLPSVVN